MVTGAGAGLLGEVGLAPRSVSGGTIRTVSGGGERSVPAGIGAITGDAEGVYGLHGMGQGSLPVVAGGGLGARGVSGTGSALIGALTGHGLGHGLGIVNTEGFYGPGHAILQSTITIRTTDDGTPRITSNGAIRTAQGGETHAHIIGAGVGIVSPPVAEEKRMSRRAAAPVGGATARRSSSSRRTSTSSSPGRRRSSALAAAVSAWCRRRGNGAHGVAGHGAGQMALVSGDAHGWHTDTVSLDNEILLLMAA